MTNERATSGSATTQYVAVIAGNCIVFSSRINVKNAVNNHNIHCSEFDHGCVWLRNGLAVDGNTIASIGRDAIGHR